MDNFKEGLTYDDVCLVPQFNNIPSRTEPTLKTWLTTKTEVDIPVIPANMDTVIGDEMADILIKNGGYPIFHRFTTFEQQMEWAKKYGDKCYISCGLNDLDSTVKILMETNCRGVCIDIAHAHSESMKNFMIELRKKIGEKEIIAGNICTPMGYQDLVNWGADAVKCGVGPGCLTSDTDILLSNGETKKIVDIIAGDTVINRFGDPVKVVNLINNGKKRVIRVKSSFSNSSLGTTPNHLFWVYNTETLKYDWKEIWDCTNSDRVVNAFKECVDDTIFQTSTISKNLDIVIEQVWDLEVDCPTNSFVANNIVVHNSACTTRKVTGFGVPQFSAVYECGQIAKKLRVPIIADGGIRGSDDIAKALAGGASTIMAGGLFANTYESTAPKFEHEGNTYMKYRGQASADFQKEYFGGLKKGTVPEGVDFLKKVTKSAQQVIDEMTGGLRSAYTYGGARNIKEFQRKAEFRVVKGSYELESKPRPFS